MIHPNCEVAVPRGAAHSIICEDSLYITLEYGRCLQYGRGFSTYRTGDSMPCCHEDTCTRITSFKKFEAWRFDEADAFV